MSSTHGSGNAVGLTSILHRGQFYLRDAVLARYYSYGDVSVCLYVRHKPVSVLYRNG